MSGDERHLQIEVKTGNMEAIIKRLTEAEHENKLLLEEKTKREEEFNKQLGEKETQRQKAEEELSKLGGKGSLPASLNTNEGNNNNVPSGTHEFDSYEEMVEWARLNDRKAYESLKKKSANGLMENKQFFEWHDTFDAQGRSLIGRTLGRANTQKRSRIK